MTEPAIRSLAAANAIDSQVVEAMVGFEHRYGGLSYSVNGGNSMDYGLEGATEAHDTPFGPAFGGLVDGHWTWGLDVLLDGRTAMGLGRLPYRASTDRLRRGSSATRCCPRCPAGITRRSCASAPPASG